MHGTNVKLLIIVLEIPFVTPDIATFGIRKLLHFSCAVCLCVQYDTRGRGYFRTQF